MKFTLPLAITMIVAGVQVAAQGICTGDHTFQCCETVAGVCALNAFMLCQILNTSTLTQAGDPLVFAALAALGLTATADGLVGLDCTIESSGTCPAGEGGPACCSERFSVRPSYSSIMSLSYWLTRLQ